MCSVKNHGYEGFYIEHQKHLEYSRAVQACDCEVIVGWSQKVFVDVDRTKNGSVHTITSQSNNKETSHDHWLANLEKLVRIIRKILAPISFYTRDSLFYALRINPAVSNIVIERDPKRHRRLRCILSAGVSLLCYYLCLMADEQWISMLGDDIECALDRHGMH